MRKIFGLTLVILLLIEAVPLSAQTITVAIASKNQQKGRAVQKAFEGKFPDDMIVLLSYDAPSNIPEQPVGEKTALKGAMNRLHALPQELLEKADYAISIENYIEQDVKTQKWVDIGLVVLKNLSAQGEEIVALTQPTGIPDKFIELAKTHSSPEKIMEEGYDCTIGRAIKEHYTNKSINAHDWHREAEFGGISREQLLSDALFKVLHQEEIQFLKDQIEIFEDFPKPGIVFSNFFPMLSHPVAFQSCINLLYERYKTMNIEAVVGLESRGFIVGAALAHKLGVGFAPVRKPGKLPGMVYSVSYEKEYGTDTIVIAHNALKENQRVLIVDDLIATGGSAKAAIDLVRMAGGDPVEFMSLLEIKEMAGRSKLGIPSFNLLD